MRSDEFSLDDLYLLEHCVTLELKRLYDLQSSTKDLKEFKQIYKEHIDSLNEISIKVSKVKESKEVEKERGIECE